jgi:membrane fusion protein (multidrug efflux system)
LIAFGVALWLRHESSFESTDDAQIDAHISAIGTRVAGTVTAVYVEDNQRVEQGQVLVQLDPSDYQVACEQARAGLEQAEFQRRGEVPVVSITTVTNETTVATSEKEVAAAQADLKGAEQDLDAAEANVREAIANNEVAQLDFVRSRDLVRAGAVAQADFDQHKATADARAAEVAAGRARVTSSQRRVDEARAKVAQAEERLGQARKNAPRQLEQSNAGVEAREAGVDGAKAALEQAALNLGYTRIVAPVAGIVGERSINVGDRVQPAQELLGIVQADDVWVTANFKETQIPQMRPGERADVSVDALAGQTFHGHVESLPGASGARFSLLPPGERDRQLRQGRSALPVRLRLEPNQPGLDRLRPGMSVEPTVWIR